MKKVINRPDFQKHLIQTAMKLVEKNGIDGLSIRKLAKALGYSTMKIYSECKGKPELLILIAEEISKEQNYAPTHIKPHKDPIEHLIHLTLLGGKYYTEKPWAAEILRITRFEMGIKDETPTFEKSTSHYRNLLKSAKLPALKTDKDIDNALNIIRSLILGSISLLPKKPKAHYKDQVLHILENGMRTLIAGWQHN